jgi:hypothetical protein
MVIWWYKLIKNINPTLRFQNFEGSPGILHAHLSGGAGASVTVPGEDRRVGNLSPSKERRSDMGRLLKKNPVVFLQKDGLVQNFFPMDRTLLAAIEKSSRSKKPTFISRWVTGFQRTLGF